MKKCFYCQGEIEEASVVDICNNCGVGVWGPKMFDAIKQNMQDAKDSDNLYQGSIGNS